MRLVRQRFAGILIGLALALSPAAWAAQPRAVIAAPSARKASQSILLDARKSVSDKPLKWTLVSHPDLPLLVLDSAPRKATYALLLDPEPGVYHFSLTAVGKVDDELEADTAVVQVVVGDVAPTPPPGPTPGPTPDPTPGPTPTPPPGPTPVPMAEVVHATLVFDLDSPDAPRAAIRTSPKVRVAAEGLNMLWRSYDDDAATVKAAGLLPFVARAGGPPALIFQAGDGRVIDALPCPPTPEGVVSLMLMMRPAASGGN